MHVQTRVAEDTDRKWMMDKGERRFWFEMKGEIVHSPQALHMGLPSVSLLQRGVSNVPQFIHGVRAGVRPFDEKLNSSGPAGAPGALAAGAARSFDGLNGS